MKQEFTISIHVLIWVACPPHPQKTKKERKKKKERKGK
jgi:hypothetical protein